MQHQRSLTKSAFRVVEVLHHHLVEESHILLSIEVVRVADCSQSSEFPSGRPNSTLIFHYDYALLTSEAWIVVIGVAVPGLNMNIFSMFSNSSILSHFFRRRGSCC
ncbi:hypothetical protein EV1_043452 [Malus domestica]